MTSFFDCVSFGNQADNVSKFVKKGRQVAIKGRMEQGDKYKDKNGNERRSWSVRVERIEFLGTKSELASKGDSFPQPLPAVDDLPDSWEQAEEDNPFE